MWASHLSSISLKCLREVSEATVYWRKIQVKLRLNLVHAETDRCTHSSVGAGRDRLPVYVNTSLQRAIRKCQLDETLNKSELTCSGLGGESPRSLSTTTGLDILSLALSLKDIRFGLFL